MTAPPRITEEQVTAYIRLRYERVGYTATEIEESLRGLTGTRRRCRQEMEDALTVLGEATP